jgi:hypothetical protein
MDVIDLSTGTKCMWTDFNDIYQNPYKNIPIRFFG